MYRDTTYIAVSYGGSSCIGTSWSQRKYEANRSRVVAEVWRESSVLLELISDTLHGAEKSWRIWVVHLHKQEYNEDSQELDGEEPDGEDAPYNVVIG